MKYGKMATAASLAACVFMGSWGGCEAAVKAAAENVQFYQGQGPCVFEHAEYRLRLPQKYAKLLLTQTKFQDGKRLFSVAEKASVAASHK